MAIGCGACFCYAFSYWMFGGRKNVATDITSSVETNVKKDIEAPIITSKEVIAEYGDELKYQNW